MGSYIIRRLLLLFPTLLGITLVVFFVMALSPGGVGGNLLNQQGVMKGGVETAKVMREYYDRRYGLDKPLMVQYARWLNEISPLGFPQNADGSFGRFGFKRPDLGTAFTKGRPVLDLFAEAMPITIMLNLITLPIIYGVAIFSGIYAARRRGKLFDLSSGATFLGLMSIPQIWAGVMLIGFLASAKYHLWFPTSGLHDIMADQMTFLPAFQADGFHRGWFLDVCWHLVLPITCLTYGGFAFLSRLTRGSVLENLASDYARTARAKGLDDRSVLFHHVFRNSLLPLITVAAAIIPSLLGGSVIVESIFSIHGMGLLMIEAVHAHDRELILGEALVTGFLGLVCYLIADLLYAVADPRVSYE